jgi:hypothetical protein
MLFFCDEIFDKNFISEKAKSDPDLCLWGLLLDSAFRWEIGGLFGGWLVEEVLPLLNIPKLWLFRNYLAMSTIKHHLRVYSPSICSLSH